MQPGAWHEGLQPTQNTYEVPPGPHRDVPAPIDVHVRIVFERDGEQCASRSTTPTTACTRPWRGSPLVTCDDARTR